MQSRRIAVIGSGIAGLSSAWLLSQQHEVVLFEASSRLGGHTHTVDIEVEGKRFAVDTGFLVFNERTYPNLCAMFDHLGVVSVPSEMSFAVSLRQPYLEWAGSNLATLFGQPRNMLRPDFWRMVNDILRFNRASQAWLSQSGEDSGPALGDYLREHGYSDAFRDWYLLPMAGSIWSCPTGQMLQYPLGTFVRFCSNHGLLQITNRPQWRTVRGGARHYVDILAKGIGEVRTATPAKAIRRTAHGVEIWTGDGVQSFDEVVMACHSDQALALLGAEATPAERAILGAVRYQPNRAVLHTDRELLPRKRSLWSAWNYVAPRGDHQAPVSVSYLINRLQPLPVQTPVVVSLNPAQEPDPSKVLAEMDYAHPVFDTAAIRAQQQMNQIQGHDRLWFCGAWTGYGFHEDGLKSGLDVASRLGCEAPWSASGFDARRAA